MPCFAQATPEEVPILKGNVQQEHFVPDVTLDTGHSLAKGERLQLIMMDLVATGYSQAGDSFDARVKTPVIRNGQLLIPAGTLVHGHVVEVLEPGSSLARRGRMILGFDQLLMPDGRKIALSAGLNKGDSAMGAVGRAVGNTALGAIAGAVQGVITGIKFGGLAAISATQGASLLATGGLGALAGMGEGLARNGRDQVLQEGDEVQVALSQPLSLPATQAEDEAVQDIYLQGLDVAITHIALERDPFKVAKQLNLQLSIHNNTPYNFGSLDMALVDQFGQVFQVSPFAGDLLALQIPPHGSFTGEAAFSVQAPEVKHYLVFYKPYTRDIVAKFSLARQMSQVQAGVISKHHTARH